MSDMMENKLNAEELTEVTGGVGRQEINVKSITPIWVKVTASSLNCRYTPNGPIAKTYEYGHKLKTADQRSPRRHLLCIHLQGVHSEDLIGDLLSDKLS